MTKLAELILEQAQALTDAERADLAEQLLENTSPSTDPAYQAAWTAEIERRLADFDSGKTKAVPWAEVRERLNRLGLRDE